MGCAPKPPGTVGIEPIVTVTGRHDLLNGYEISRSDSGDSFARRELMAEG
jgi:hypothetical protein